MDEEYINLKLKKFGNYRTTSVGVFLFTEHDFRIFVSNETIKEIINMKFKNSILKDD